jgi:hypothetical protein
VDPIYVYVDVDEASLLKFNALADERKAAGEGLYQLPRLKPHLLDMTGHSRPNLDRFHRICPSGKFLPFGDLPLLHRRHRHDRRRRRWRLGGFAPTPIEQEK